jgi:hypothetical protein
VGALAVYVLLCTGATDFPNGSGVRYGAVWLALAAPALAAAAAAARLLRPASSRLRPVEALAILAILTMLLTDVTMAWQPLRDLEIYLRAGRAFLDGTPVYDRAPLLVQPEDRTLYPFLYPPCTLPLFGALAILPRMIAQALWVGSSIALGLAALRLFGLPRRWLLPALVWPPLFQGLWVGNVAVPALALFALAPWFGAGLALGAVFKAYTGLAGLWLAREKRWRSLASGLGMLTLLAIITVPLTGAGAWRDWLDGLAAYRTSQAAVPGLYGFGLLRYVPEAVFAAAAAATILAALRARGMESLARFGAAAAVAGPSLFGHGMLAAVPALLSLRAAWLWLAVGLLSVPDGPQWWLAIAVVGASWIVPAMRRPATGVTAEAEPLHPLPPGSGPWPTART